MTRRHCDRALLDLYSAETPHDEIAFWLRCNLDGKELWPNVNIPMADLNHLWSVGRRPDLRSNIIALSRENHRQFHADLPAGRVCCLLAKARKAAATNAPEEFDLSELDFAAGKSVAGWVEVQRFDREWLQEFRVELLERMKTIPV